MARTKNTNKPSAHPRTPGIKRIPIDGGSKGSQGANAPRVALGTGARVALPTAVSTLMKETVRHPVKKKARICKRGKAVAGLPMEVDSAPAVARVINGTIAVNYKATTLDKFVSLDRVTPLVPVRVIYVHEGVFCLLPSGHSANAACNTRRCVVPADPAGVRKRLTCSVVVHPLS